MDLKFYLNKFVKVDNIEPYPLKYLYALRKKYMEFLDGTDGTDPDFPLMSIGDKKGKDSESFKGSTNKVNLSENDG